MKKLPTARSFALMNDELVIELIWNQMISSPNVSINSGVASTTVELHFDLPQYVQDYFTNLGYVLDNYQTDRWTISTP